MVLEALSDHISLTYVRTALDRYQLVHELQELAGVAAR